MATKIKWEDADFKWELAPTTAGVDRYTWDEVLLVEEIAEEIADGAGAGAEEIAWNVDQLDPEKKKRFIKLICKVKGKTIKQTKEIKNYKIKATDIKLLAEKVLGIEVITENIKF